ncbi:ABC transporter ATP-binding protein [Nonomuraea aurantiaca]|uniref:ABC transporter ATP-binding protein n=1 Tax=Nonomuraea aurantiaca TaxID=2878562 RepID=UPI003FD8A476
MPELTATENVALPLLFDRHGRQESLNTARSWLERLNAADCGDQRPGTLSGGQAQRVAMARALVTGPRVVFADEPTGALDSLAGEQLMDELTHTARADGITLVIVTHDNRVAAYADRELVSRDGELAAEVAA